MFPSSIATSISNLFTIIRARGRPNKPINQYKQWLAGPTKYLSLLASKAKPNRIKPNQIKHKPSRVDASSNGKQSVLLSCCRTGSPPNQTFVNLNNKMGTASSASSNDIYRLMANIKSSNRNDIFFISFNVQVEIIQLPISSAGASCCVAHAFLSHLLKKYTTQQHPAQLFKQVKNKR